MVKAPSPRSLLSPGGRLPLGRSFLRILKSSFDAGRFSRGREIFEHQRVLSVEWVQAQVTSRVKGRPKPYRDYGGCPVYEAWIRFEPLPDAELHPALDEIGSRVGLAAQLISHDVCWREDRLLPTQFEAGCSCPDAKNPCKHIAALIYFLARRLDHDPLVLFELRGMSRAGIEERLGKTPLGGIILSSLRQTLPLPAPSDGFFTHPESEEVKAMMTPTDYFGCRAAGSGTTGLQPLGIPGILIRKGGDYPRFWEGDESFIKVMEALYSELRRRLPGAL